MKFSDERIKELQTILKEEFGLDYTTEQAQEAGIAIVRFVLAKTQRQLDIKTRDMEINYASKSRNAS
jgi:hypothetical protein